MSPVLLIALGFVAAVTAVLGIFSIISDLFLRDRTRVSQRVDDEFRKRQRDRAQKGLLFKDLSVMGSEAAEDVAKDNSWRERLVLTIEQAGMELTPKRLLGFIGASGLLAATIGTLIGRSPWIGALVGLLGAYIPLAVVQLKRKSRLGRLLAHLKAAAAGRLRELLYLLGDARQRFAEGHL